MRPLAAAGLLLLGLGGCAELAERPTPLPAGLAGPGDPVRSMAVAVDTALADGGRRLNGRPEEMALALARLEHLTEALGRDPRLVSVPEGTRLQMVAARREARGALGMAEDVPAERAIAALLETRRALLAADRAAAGAALAPVTRPGGLPPLARLSEMGGLPQAALASAALREQIAALDAGAGWRGNAVLEGTRQGISTSGLGGRTDR